MITSASKLDGKLKDFIRTIRWMEPESADLSKLYWGQVDTNSTYTALTNGAAATYESKLTKQQVIDALSFIEDVDDFFTNDVLAQADYLLNIEGIVHGNEEYSSPGISVAIEAFGTRAVTFCQSALSLFKAGKEITSLYVDTEISTAVAALTGEEIPWLTINKTDFLAGIALVENFVKLTNNQVAVQADYGATVASWAKVI